MRPHEESLHHGLGVRSPDVLKKLGPLAAKMHVSADDLKHIALGKIIWYTSWMIRQVTRDPKWITVFEVAYNLPQEPKFNKLNLMDRLKWLNEVHGWSASRSNTKLSDVRELRLNVLRGPFPPPNVDQIAALTESERRYAADGGSAGHQRLLLPRYTLGQLIADQHQTGRRVPDCVLPQTDLHFAISAADNLVTMMTPDFGETLATFTTVALLREYREVLSAPESDRPVRCTGREVIAALVRQGRVGLAVNPLGGHGAQVGLHWSPEELVKL